ncbi:MAG: hypothetical protein FWC26_13265 [Fibromonadales bacterium]|nr:hypothetical protein [Fibromonadales bacterium]
MAAKIFKDSDSIYQDQAKVLFNFYSKAAEKIVAEEEKIEGEIKSQEDSIPDWERIKSKAATMKIVFLALGIVGLVVGIALLATQGQPFGLLLATFVIGFFTNNSKMKVCDRTIASIAEKIESLKKEHENVFRDYKVTKLGVAYVPVAEQIKYGEQSFIIDYTGDVQDSKIELQIPKNSDLLSESVNKLEKLSEEAPIVETSEEIEEIATDEYSRSIQFLNQHDYFGNLDRTLRTISFCVGDLNMNSVELPLVATKSQYASFLKEFATSEIPENAPIFEVFDKEKHRQSIEKFKDINKMKESISDETAEFEEVLKRLMLSVANSVQNITAIKISSTDKIVSESNRTLFKILKAPYNHYSPSMEFEEIERIKQESFNYGKDNNDYQPFQLKDSSKVRYDLFSDVWRAEDGSQVNAPFGVHQLYQEIVAPMVQSLMEETRMERLKVYNHIRDKKMDYLTQWHRDVEDFYGRNRAEAADLRNIMSESFRNFSAALNTLNSLKETARKMETAGDLKAAVVKNKQNVAETFAGYEMQTAQFKKTQDDFDAYMDMLKDDIDEKAQRFDHVEYYDASLRDKNFKDAAVAESEKQNLDLRRKQLLAVDPLFAKSSELLPEPSIEEVTMEHVALNLPAIAKNALNELLEKSIYQDNAPANPAPEETEEEVEEEAEEEIEDETEEEIEEEAVEETEEEAVEEEEGK